MSSVLFHTSIQISPQKFAQEILNLSQRVGGRNSSTEEEWVDACIPSGYQDLQELPELLGLWFLGVMRALLLPF